ncbi:hypothetical protein CDIK_3227 [Cucumispora dikerogammari]|nr:hypothetical protein CDIK_3227 [Cucumispora dikerogammari]
MPTSIIKLHKFTFSSPIIHFNKPFNINLILDILQTCENIKIKIIYLNNLNNKNNSNLILNTIQIDTLPEARISLDLSDLIIYLKKPIYNSTIFVNDDYSVNYNNNLINEKLNIDLINIFGNTSLVISVSVNEKEIYRLGFIINVQYPNIPNSILEYDYIEDDCSDTSDSNSSENSEDNENSEGDNNSNENSEGDNNNEEDNNSNENSKESSNNNKEIDSTRKETSDIDSSISSNSNNSNNSNNGNNSNNSNDNFTYIQPPITSISPPNRLPYLNYILDINEIYFTISNDVIESHFDLNTDSGSLSEDDNSNGDIDDEIINSNSNSSSQSVIELME